MDTLQESGYWNRLAGSALLFFILVYYVGKFSSFLLYCNEIRICRFSLSVFFLRIISLSKANMLEDKL